MAYSLAFVAPRYGPDVVGGAETLARQTARQLRRRGHRVTVLTTCAVSHFTWENALPAGETEDAGVRVIRFPVGERDPGRFLSLQDRIDRGETLSFGEEMDWMAESVVSPTLFAHLREHGGDYDLIFFTPYMFGTTFWGALIRPERSVLIPCLHDEPFAQLAIFRLLFSEVAGVLCNSSPEADLVRSLYGLEGKPVGIAGLGFDRPEGPPDPALFRGRLRLKDPYCLYLGRLEGGKNAPLLVGYFAEYQRLDPKAPHLILGGGGEISLPPLARIRNAGFLDDAAKRSACAGSLCLIQPSVNESFSIVIMEQWLARRPVIVNAACPVTAHHALASGGGLTFADFFELREGVSMLSEDAGLAGRLGEAGRAYVEREYSWEAVLPRYETFIASLLGRREAA